MCVGNAAMFLLRDSRSRVAFVLEQCKVLQGPRGLRHLGVESRGLTEVA